MATTRRLPDNRVLPKVPTVVEEYLIQDLRKRKILGATETKEFRVLPDNSEDMHTTGQAIHLPPGFVELVEDLLEKGIDPAEEYAQHFNGIAHECGHDFYGDALPTILSPNGQRAMLGSWTLLSAPLALTALRNPTILKTLGVGIVSMPAFFTSAALGMIMTAYDIRQKERRADQFAIDHAHNWQELETTADHYDFLADKFPSTPGIFDYHPPLQERAQMFKAAAEKLKQQN
jgi:hypothetical protein